MTSIPMPRGRRRNDIAIINRVGTLKHHTGECEGTVAASYSRVGMAAKNFLFNHGHCSAVPTQSLFAKTTTLQAINQCGYCATTSSGAASRLKAAESSAPV